MGNTYFTPLLDFNNTWSICYPVYKFRRNDANKGREHGKCILFGQNLPYRLC